MKSYVLSNEDATPDIRTEQKSSFLEIVLLCTVATFLVILLFGKECFLAGKDSIIGYIQWFFLTGLSYCATYTGIPLAALAIIVKVICNPKREVLGNLFSGFSIWIIFCIYLTISTIVTSASKDVMWHKNVIFTQTLPAIALTIAVLFYGRSGLTVLRSVIIGYSLLLAFTMLINRDGVIGSALSNTEMSELYIEENVIGTARALYYCGFALAYWGISSNQSVLTRVICGCASLVLISAGFSTGSRGPLLAFLVSMPIWIAMLRTKMISKIAVLAFVLFAVVIGWGLVQRYVPDASAHLSNYSDSGRSQYGYSIVLHSSTTLFGRGTGSFAMAGSLIYPHNLFLEMYYEHGIMGLLVLLILLGSVGHCLLLLQTRTDDPYNLWILVSYIYFLICAQFSCALVQQTGLWLFTLIGLRCPMAIYAEEKVAMYSVLRGKNAKLQLPVSETNDL